MLNLDVGRSSSVATRLWLAPLRLIRSASRLGVALLAAQVVGQLTSQRTLKDRLLERDELIVNRRPVQGADGSKIRTLTIVDVFTKEALAIEVGQRLKGEHVVSALNRIAARRGAPRHLFVDNGSEFSGRLLDMWAYHYRAKIDFSRPGKPTDNRHIETFNGSFRDECLNLHWFETLGEAKAIVEAWRRDYNESRPHSALKELAPAEFARQLVLSVGPSGPETPENPL